MTGRIVSGLLTVAVVLGASVGSAAARDLTFEERIRAQEAIERVYFSHQTGTSRRTFAQVYTQEMLARKVRTYLAQSAALESIWKTPVTSEMLQKELERMARQTRMPERLQELYQALGNDSFVIQECLARPALVDRMSRSFFATDGMIHAGTRRSAEEIHDLLKSHRLDPWTNHPNRTEFHLVRVDASHGNQSSPSDEERSDERAGRTHVDLQPEEFARWDALLPEKAGQVGPLVEEREAFVVRSTLDRRPGEVRTVSYAVKKRDWDSWWQGTEGDMNPLSVKAVAEEGRALPRPLAGQPAALDSSVATLSSSLSGSLTLATAPTAIADNTWSNGSFYSVPDPRFHHTAIWTGSVMVIWGGFNSGAYLDTGAKYDPTIDTWTPTTMVNAPSPRGLHTAVWDGVGMIIWGGYFNRNIVLAEQKHAVCKDITPLILCSSDSDCPNNICDLNNPHTFPEVTVHDFAPLGDGSEYLPDADIWFPLDASAVFGTPPGPRYGHMAVWAPPSDALSLGKMIIWGGYGIDKMPLLNPDPTTPGYLNSGVIYDENFNSWVPITTAGAPLPRWQGVAVWADNKFIVWGGFGVTQYLDPPTNTKPLLDVLQTGGMYDPTTDAWAPTSVAGAPTARQDFSAVWSPGNARMVIWGGIGRSSSGLVSSTLGDGALFNPAANTWTPVATTGAPGRRYFHSTVWTGSEMLVWGGFDGNTGTYGTYLNTGGRYNPVSNTWSAISNSNAPSVRFRHTAVWTGSTMIVWGGSISGASLDTGGRYTLGTDTWTPTATGSGPARRSGHTGVWTGSRMIIWGGRDRMIPSDYNTGSQYDPAIDQWSDISTTGAPSARAGHGAVWTDGGKMLIWGGRSTQPAGSTIPYLYLNTGGRYDPATDSWTAISGTNAPSGRFQHSTVWTGSEMIVWGGGNPTILGTGGRYNPVTDAWTATSNTGSPDARQQHTAVWTGNEMIVWGGTTSSSSQVNTGGRYKPATDSWVPTSTALFDSDPHVDPRDVPEKRSLHAAVWTGSRMLIWGGWLAVTDANGFEKNQAGNTGGQYDPATDTWAGTTTFNTPPPAIAPAYVWTGNQLLVWGGSTLLSGPYVSTGGRYDPAADHWTAISQTNAPSPRVQASTVWTGNLMLTWGGFNGAPMSSGGRYSSLSGSALSVFFLDRDGDGLGDPSLAIQGYSAPAGYVADVGADCNDADLTVWATPSEVPSLSFSDASGMNWLTPSAPGAVSVGYDLLRTGNAANFVTAPTCVSSGTLITSAIDEAVPSPGRAFYYLVRARNGCPNGSGIGVLGFDSAGAVRPGSPCQ